MLAEQPSEEHQGHFVKVPINWRTAETVPIQLANQFLLQYMEGNFILSAGQIAPPSIIGPSEEEIRSAVTELSVITLDRFVMTPERTRALILLLRRQLRRFHPELSQEIEEEQE